MWGEINLEEKLSFSIESPTFYDDLTVQDNLKLFASLSGIGSFDIHQLLIQVKLEDAGLKKFRQLSLGMKQKLSIARILMSQSDVILLDEPFNGLDVITKEQLREIMIMLRSQGKLLIISSHILEELGEVSDVIWYLKSGKIQRIINLNSNQRTYHITILTDSNANDLLKVKYHATWLFDTAETSTFRLELLRQDSPMILKSLIDYNVAVLEYVDVTNDLRSLMVEET